MVNSGVSIPIVLILDYFSLCFFNNEVHNYYFNYVPT